MFIVEDRGYSVTNVLPLFGLGKSDISEGPKLWSYQIYTAYIDAVPRY